MDPPADDQRDRDMAPVPGDAALVGTDFVACYQDHYGRLVRALRLAGADAATAEDAAQEAFARALARWRRVARGPNPPGYVYLSAFRLLRRSEHRRRRPERAGPSLAQGVTDDDATTAVSVAAALEGMPARRRQCAVLCLLLGFSPTEAGEQLGIAPATVRKHLDEARIALRVACNPDSPEDRAAR